MTHWTDQQIINELRRELAALHPDSELIDHLRDAADAGHDNAHGQLPEAQRGARGRWSRTRVGMLLPIATVLVTIGVAGAALTVLRRRGSAPATTPTVAHRITSDRNAPAAVSRAEVAASLRLRALPVGRYCIARSTRLVPCQAGRRPVTAQPIRLVELAFTARRTTGERSWYWWTLKTPDTRRCANATQWGQPSGGLVRSGTRVVFYGLVAADCSGTVNAEASYWTEAPRAETEHAVLVGRSTLRLP
jgi:hypothetical protein